MQELPPGFRVVSQPQAQKPSSGIIRGVPEKEDPLERRERELIIAELENKTSAPRLTEAQKAVDKAFAKEYVAWTTQGGFSDFQKQAEQIKTVINDLSKSDSLTGAFVGRLPDSVNQFFGNEEAIEARDLVEEVVQRNLRLILGAQFTNEEGKRLIARAYNPTQDEALNKKRLERLLKQMQAAAAKKMEAARYYEENGTLSGWQSKLPSIGDFDPERDTPSQKSVPSDIKALMKKYGGK